MKLFRPQARGGIENIGEVPRTCLPRETCGLRFLSVAGQFPFGKPLSEVCSWLRCSWFHFLVGSYSLSYVFCVVALFSAVDPVAVEASRRPSACLPPERSERIVRRGGYALRAVFFPVVRPERLGIMAGMDQEA